MKKEEYLQKLEQLLSDIPAEDRQEAIRYYHDYLEDAGEQAEEVIHSLGTPEELACSIKKELYGEHTSGSKFPVGRPKESKKGKFTAGQWILLLTLCLCAAPVIIPICGTVLSILLAIVIALAAIVFGAGIAGIALVIAAIAVVIVAIVKVFFAPLSSAIMLGGGLLMVGIGLIGIAFSVWVLCKVLPKLFIWFVNVCSGIVHRK